MKYEKKVRDLTKNIDIVKVKDYLTNLEFKSIPVSKMHHRLEFDLSIKDLNKRLRILKQLSRENFLELKDRYFIIKGVINE